jgi:hypothetical protein
MSKPATHSFQAARDKFIKALNDYQTATRDKNMALQRIFTETHSIRDGLSQVVSRAVPMVTPGGAMVNSSQKAS